MSALDRPKIDDAESVLANAENVLSELCHGKRFEMCVPVRDTDTDIVLGNALYIGRRLLAEIEALKARERIYIARMKEINKFARTHANETPEAQIYAWGIVEEDSRELPALFEATE
jgi:hypothetical protein